MNQPRQRQREAPGINAGYHRTELVTLKRLTVDAIRDEFCDALSRVSALSDTNGSFLFRSSYNTWLTWFGLIFTTGCFMRAVDSPRSILWSTFKGSSDIRLRHLLKSISDKREWCAVDNECRGLDVALTDGHAAGVCAGEFEAGSIVTKQGHDGQTTKHVNDLVKLMRRPFPLRIFHARANERANRRDENVRRDWLAWEAVSEVIYAHRNQIHPGDQIFVSIATTSKWGTFSHAIGEWCGGGLTDDTLWKEFHKPV